MKTLLQKKVQMQTKTKGPIFLSSTFLGQLKESDVLVGRISLPVSVCHLALDQSQNVL